MRVLFLRSNTPFGQLLQGLVRIFIRMFLLYCCAFYALDVFLLCCLWRNKRNKSTPFFVLKQLDMHIVRVSRLSGWLPGTAPK